jgi:SSS family solute:Na+ symporter
VYCVLYGLAAALIGMCAKVLLPHLPDVNNAFAAVIQFALPDGLRSLIITAAVAAMMSTASAGLLAAASTISEDLLPIVRGGKPSAIRTTRWCTLATGVLVLLIALRVSDVLSALTLAYDLLVGGMLVPLMGAIYWKRATPAAAMISMFSGCATALGFMLKDGIDANSPVYCSLAVSLVSFVAATLLSRPPIREGLMT